jgi:hypothetical protein
MAETYDKKVFDAVRGFMASKATGKRAKLTVKTPVRTLFDRSGRGLRASGTTNDAGRVSDRG